MKVDHFRRSLTGSSPALEWSAALRALWWDAKGDWAKAHELVNELETPEAMAVHAYLHRKEGDFGNAEYWYKRAGRTFRRETLDQEWEALVAGLQQQA